MSYYSSVKAILAGKGIGIRSASEPMVDDTPIGRFLEGVIVLNGQLDNEIKGSTTTDNMRSLAMQGYWQHGPLLGYEKHTMHNEVGKPRPTLKPDATAPLIIKLLNRFGEGDINPMQLHRYAVDELKIKTKPYTKKDGTRVPPKLIGKNGIYQILKRPEYAGYVHDKFTNYELVEGKHEALISKELYEHNQKLLNKKVKVKETYSKHNPTYPLKEVLLCIGCNKPLYGSAPKTGGGKSNSARYHCYRKGCEDVNKRSLGIGETHEAWLAMLRHVQPTDGFLRGYKEILIRQAAKENERINDKVKAQRDVMSDIADTRLNAIEDRLIEKDEKRKSELSELIERLDNRKLDAKDKLDELEAQQTVQEAKITYAINHMHDIAKQWLDADYDLRVRFQTMLFPQGTTFDMTTMHFGTEKISPLYRYAANKKDLSEPEKSSLVTLVQSIYKELVDEIIRWNDILSGLNYRESAAF